MRSKNVIKILFLRKSQFNSREILERGKFVKISSRMLLRYSRSFYVEPPFYVKGMITAHAQ